MHVALLAHHAVVQSAESSHAHTRVVRLRVVRPMITAMQVIVLAAEDFAQVDCVSVHLEATTGMLVLVMINLERIGHRGV